jgi:dTDP-glucose 4,6-dehydratase
VIRPFNNYGPYQHPEKVIPRFIIQALTDQPLTIHGGGRASRDWLHVFDTAEAITRACEVPVEQISGRTINVATGVDESVEQIADMILGMLDKPSSLKAHIADRPGQVDRHIGSTGLAAELLGWRSSISFEDGLERTIAWYRDNPQWWQKVLSGEQTAQAV